ncbi:MAG: 16S rRNA (cytidine(1402)-2'-O)-methyltransferase [Dehalococcoidales bacterium]|nr:16S rRNA (cytidine(1402)-2'-O)-methyltransferase [Dehalococcoidales bacterium]
MTLFMRTLYIVATPIGNLEDISLRALRVLKEVKLIAAEDTRKTSRLLTHYRISTPMTSYYEHNKLVKLNRMLSYLDEGDVALVSEAGMPGISDPGYELIAAALEHGIPVVPLPGASAVTTALAVSGLPTDRFTFLGFLPNKSTGRRHLLESVKMEKGTLIILEAPHRLQASLKDILSVLGDRRMAACRELTKIHEEIYRGTISQAISHFTAPKGEFTLVIEGNRETTQPVLTEEIGGKLKALHHSGVSAKEAIAGLAAETGLSKRELYRAWLEQI